MTQDEFSIKKQELEIREYEVKIELQRLEAEKLAQQSKAGSFALTPVSATIIVALLGLIGTSMNYYFQKEASLSLEKQKFQFGIYSKAQESGTPEQAAQILDFYIKAKLIPGKEGQFSELIKEGKTEEVPIFNEGQRTIEEVYGKLEIPKPSSDKTEIKDYFLLGKNVTQSISTNTSSKFEPGYPDAIVLGYSANNSLNGTVDILKLNQIQASVHFVVDKDGSITQVIPLNYISWGVGQGRYNNRTGWNKYSIRIQLINGGRLIKQKDKFICPIDQSEIPANMVLKARHKNETSESYWQKYTPEQIKSVSQLCKLLSQEYKLKYLIGQEDFTPQRKTSPGPAFPLAQLQKEILK